MLALKYCYESNPFTAVGSFGLTVMPSTAATTVLQGPLAVASFVSS